MSQQQTTLSASASGFFSSQRSLLDNKADEYRQIESAFNEILSQFSEPMSIRKKELFEVVAKVKEKVP